MLSQVFYAFTGFLAGRELNIKLVAAVLWAINLKQHYSFY